MRMCVHAYMQVICVEAEEISLSWFSPAILWDLGTESRLLVLYLSKCIDPLSLLMFLLL